MAHITSSASPHSLTTELRALIPAWAIATFLPIPILVTSAATDVSCLYLGIMNAWLVTEFHRTCGLPSNITTWHIRTVAALIAVLTNAVLFIAFGFATGVTTHFPFSLMAILSVIPAIGIIPWILRRIPQRPYASIILGGFLIFACKLAACVVARFVYGPDYMEQGYIAGDWRTAKLMITLLWTFSTVLSLALLYADHKSCSASYK
ncbi:MAG TPA: hypothetical protein VGH19_05005 [Verrucomicrobiae bacterium]